ncbi:hypothetical protein CA85_05930 [Allorhodopirellula solitaria]|uniref:Uncharacterized protein n=1 Tax=Allorhodopirellula solitaria TaxID=2527987 RepID=A0A5C5YK65_9BACT|nr:hypothetical protein CA85_05930 [Allorhodopirellula solitaria]
MEGSDTLPIVLPTIQSVPVKATVVRRGQGVPQVLDTAVHADRNRLLPYQPVPAPLRLCASPSLRQLPAHPPRRFNSASFETSEGTLLNG